MNSVLSGVSRCAPKSAAIVGVICLLCLGGCNSIKVKLGRRLYIAKVPVTSMDVAMPRDPAGVAPGEQSPLVLKFTEPDGTVLMSEGQGKGKVLWSDIAVAPTVVSVNKKGIVTTPHDPRKTDGKTGHVTITVPSHPDLKAELDIPLRYDYAFAANFSGANGSNGADGSNGLDGSSGLPGSTDPDNPSPGGNGGDGSPGGNGEDGKPGDDGPAVEVRVTLREGDHPLLQAEVSAKGHKDHFYLIDVNGGSLTVNDNGGSGGSGGNGGRGGAGGSGGIGIPSGSNGNSGANGLSGFPGSSGRAGSITVTYDPKVKPYLALIHLSNKGGPAPVFKEEAVVPLW